MTSILTMGIRTVFKNHQLVFDKLGEWHTLATCYWTSPSPLKGHIDLQAIYPDLEDFFTKKLRVKKASPVALLREIKKTAEQRHPKIEALRSLLINTGRIITTGKIEADARKALEDLHQVKFLPKRLRDGSVILVYTSEEFAVLDCVRYGKAFADHEILLDFDIHETQILHAMLRSLGLEQRYLSVGVTEQSSVVNEGSPNHIMSRILRNRAYGLYW
jgi:hypothetical protein